MHRNTKYWIGLYIAVAIIAMFIYGEYFQEQANEQSPPAGVIPPSDSFAINKQDNAIRENELKQKNDELKRKIDSLSSLNESLVQTQDRTDNKDTKQTSTNIQSELNNNIPQTNEVTTDVQQNYNSVHPFGKGYGMIAVYKKCLCYNLKVWIDNEYLGAINTASIYSTPLVKDMLSKKVTSGIHYLSANDDQGHSWKQTINVKEDLWVVHAFTPETP